MKKQPFLFYILLTLLIFSCKENNQGSAPEGSEYEVTGAIEFGDYKPTKNYSNQEIEAFYNLGLLGDKKAFNEANELDLLADFPDRLKDDPNSEFKKICLAQIQKSLKELPEEEVKVIEGQVYIWANLRKTLSYYFIEISETYMLEEAYEIPALRRIIHKHIDPTIGQSVASLSSAQHRDLLIEFCNYLISTDRANRLAIVGELLTRCSEREEE